MSILGIGSPAGDDQAGWLTVDALLAGGLRAGDELAILKLDRPGPSLVNHLQNTDRVILVDAMQTGGRPGRILRFDEENWPSYSQGLSSHGFGVVDALLLARALGVLPPQLDVYGIEIGAACPGGQAGSEIKAAACQIAQRIAVDLMGAARHASSRRD